MGKLWGLALVLCLAATAHADDKAKQKAGELVKQAIAKSQAGDHAAAIELYLQAYNLVQNPLLLSNIGSEYQKSGKSVEAVKNFCKYIAEDPTGANVDYATAQVKTLQTELGNDVEEKDPCKAKPKPVVPAPPVTPPPVTPPPNGVGTTPAEGLAPLAPSRTLEYAGYGTAAAGAIVFGIGVYYGLQAKDLSDQISNHPTNQPWPDNIKQMESDGKSDQTKQIVFMVGGGVVLGAGVVMALLGRSHAENAEHVSLVPVASPTAVGFGLDGRF
jgi:tetratricopeptide (TPR) repeat protein